MRRVAAEPTVDTVVAERDGDGWTVVEVLLSRQEARRIPGELGRVFDER